VSRGLTPHVAWRVSFVAVPFVSLITIAACILIFAPDTPTGPWKDRHLNSQVVDVAPYTMEEPAQTPSTPTEKKPVLDTSDVQFAEATLVKAPSRMDIFKVFLSRPTILQCTLYFVTFGAELAVNSNLSSFYIKSSGTPPWSQTLAANWAAMYGLLNVVTRPLGGYIGDLLYPVAGVEGKKYWVIACALFQGIILTTIGFLPNMTVYQLIGAVAAAAVFTDAGNGANFAVVPHVHPANNGIVSGLTGASGNLGGVVFALVFRFNGTNYHKSYWIIGVISMALALCVSWIRVPKLPGEVGFLGKPRHV